MDRAKLRAEIDRLERAADGADLHDERHMTGQACALTDVLNGAYSIQPTNSPNEEMTLLAALRYAIGRQSYGVGMVTEHLTSRIPAMSPTLREQLAREIDEVERGGSSHAGALGDEQCDAVRWRALRDALRVMDHR